jgi:hypothetical protein
MKFRFLDKVPETFPAKDESFSVKIRVQGIPATAELREHYHWSQTKGKDYSVFAIRFYSKQSSPVDVYSCGETSYVRVAYSLKSRSYGRGPETVIIQAANAMIEKNFTLWQRKRQGSFNF